MKTVPLGNTGVEVSVLCLGAMYFGTRNDQATSYSLLDQYVEAGGTFIDTANNYAVWVPSFKGGESESLLCSWMKTRKNRHQLFIATKVGFKVGETQSGLRYKQILEECEKSLRRMGIDSIDLYYAHKDDRSTPMEETLEAFDQLIKAGKVRFIGASNFYTWRLEEALWTSKTHGWSEYCCIQQRHSYLRPRPETNIEPQVAVNADLLDYCRNRKITLLAYSPLLSGAYTRSDRSFPEEYVGADSQARLNILRFIAASKGVSQNQVILAWMLNSDPFVLPLIAASTNEQMKENLAALDLQLTEEEMNTLNQAGA